MALCLKRKPPGVVSVDLLTMHSIAIVHQQWPYVLLMKIKDDVLLERCCSVAYT